MDKNYIKPILSVYEIQAEGNICTSKVDVDNNLKLDDEDVI